MLAQELINLGLTEKEASLYMQLLELGMQPAGVFTKKNQIPRSTVQFMLETLVKKKFATKTSKNKVVHYIPVPPETLYRLLEQERAEVLNAFSQKKQDLDVIIPKLQELANKNVVLPRVTFYQGVENVAQAYLDFLNNVPAGETIYNYVSPATEKHMEFRNAMGVFIDSRINKGIHCQCICTYCEDAVRLKVRDEVDNRETLISFETGHDIFFSESLIYNNMTLNTSYSASGIFACFIIDADITRMNMGVFKLAWKQAILDDVKICKKKQVQEWFKKYSDIQHY